MSEMADVVLMAFFAAVAWMVWRGYAAKPEYLASGPPLRKPVSPH
jgi:hypothetical protein